MEAPEPSFFLFTLNTRIVFPFANAVINALKHNIYYNEYCFMKDKEQIGGNLWIIVRFYVEY